MKYLLCVFTLTLVCLFVSCDSLNKNNDISTENKIQDIHQIDNEEDDKAILSLAKLYCMALDSLMPIDEALNSNMEYISIDIETLEINDEVAKNYIKEYFSKYNVPVIFESYDSLKEQGKVNDMNSLEGILLSITKKEISDKKAVIEGSKYRSGLGAIGVYCELINKDDAWKLKESKMTWISWLDFRTIF